MRQQDDFVFQLLRQERVLLVDIWCERTLPRGRTRLALDNVEADTCKSIVVQRCDERVSVDDGAAADVDEIRRRPDCERVRRAALTSLI